MCAGKVYTAYEFITLWQDRNTCIINVISGELHVINSDLVVNSRVTVHCKLLNYIHNKLGSEPNYNRHQMYRKHK